MRETSGRAMTEEGVEAHMVAKKDVAGKSMVADELVPLARGKMMNLKASEDTFEALTTAYIVLNELKKHVEKRLEAVKPSLHAHATAYGEKDEKGSYFADVGDNKICRRRSVSEMPNSDKLKALLETRNIELLDCFDIEKVVKLNASKLKLLIDLGKLKADEVDALRDEGFSIYMTGGKDLMKSVSDAFKPQEADTPPKAPKKPRSRK